MRVIKYCTLPGVIPRLKDLFGSGFGMLAFLLAQILGSARLLPRGHAYLNAANIGTFGLRHAMAAGAANLKWRRENADQITIYILLLTGIVILAIQIALLVFVLFSQSAFAQYTVAPPPDSLNRFSELFVALNSEHDIAYVLLDRIFGVEGIFNTCVSDAAIVCFDDTAFPMPAGSSSIRPYPVNDGPFPWPFHHAFHDVMAFYTVGMIVIALLIFTYFIFIILAETAQTGTAFGRRFNHVWAPIRMVVAIALLIPIANGLNSGQYFTLYVAKFGSGMASNGWSYFLGNLDMNENEYVAHPESPDTTYLGEFMSLYYACRYFYENQPTKVADGTADSNTPVTTKTIRPYLVSSVANPTGTVSSTVMEIEAGTTFDQALLHFKRPVNLERPDGSVEVRDILDTEGLMIVLGEHDPAMHKDQRGYVYPYCGKLFLPSLINTALPDPPTTLPTALTDSGNYALYKAYFDYVKSLLLTTNPNSCAISCTDFYCYAEQLAVFSEAIVDTHTGALGGFCGQTLKELREGFVENFDTALTTAVDAAATQESMNFDSNFSTQAVALGWAGAGIWYHKLAQTNGAIITSLNNIPVVMSKPYLMNEVAKERSEKDGVVMARDRFHPETTDKQPVQNLKGNDLLGAQIFWTVFNGWSVTYVGPTSNIFVDTVRTLFGTSGLINIRNPNNEDVHPLALLSGIGKSLVESAITNLGYSAVSMVGGGMATIAGKHNISAVGLTASSFFFSVAMLGLSVGVILFYIMPFLPFLYFFFAVGRWVKTIFEAMVGLPLWALAHIRIDGEGLPGEAAMTGYYLIFDIFLRPILILFGLLASITIFAAQVNILNEIWTLVVTNIGGFDTKNINTTDGTLTMQLSELRQSHVDQFFYTVIYAIIVYLLGMASFKLIDQIPNHILRWMGANAETFAEKAPDPADNLVRNSYIGTNQLTGAMGSAHSSLSGIVEKSGAMR